MGRGARAGPHRLHRGYSPTVVVSRLYIAYLKPQRCNTTHENYRGIRRGLLGEVDEEHLDEVVDQGSKTRARVRSGGGTPLAHGAVS